MKRFLLLFSALFLLTFAGCGKPTPRNYLNDLSAAELADLADDALSEDFRAADADHPYFNTRALVVLHWAVNITAVARLL